MEHSKLLIKKTKKKFFLYSFIGITLVAFVSYFALTLHVANVKNQSSIQEIYTMVSKQESLVGKISLLSESFLDTKLDKATEGSIEIYNELLKELNRENNKLNNWFAQNDLPSIGNLEGLLEESDVNMQMLAFIKRAQDLANSKDLSNAEIRKNIQFLTDSSRKGLIGVLTAIGQKLHNEQTASLQLFNKMGFTLVGLSILQVILVWLLVFRPLHLTILAQHQKITDALLRAKSASRSKTDFLANISHEIRTPMTAIMGYADILRRDTIDLVEREDAVKIINQNADHLLGLIDEILDISKIEAGRFDFENEEVHLSSLLNEVYSLIHVKSKDKGIDLIFRNKGEIPEKIMTDPKRLKQILFNILGNAIKFTEQGYVELNASYKALEQKLSIKIKDTGIGIAPKHIKKLFKPFEQGDSSVTRLFGGTGLGLVLSKQLAKGMGGDVKILKSKIEQGTTMEILIDIGEPEKLELVSSFSTNVIVEKEVVINEAILSDKNILVVDDAKENSRLFQLYLKEAGANVSIANDGEAALDAAKAETFDIILLDLQMPGKDGFQVISELRENKFFGPVVALTAHAMKEEKIKTRNAGFDGHITKPVKPKDLIHYVSNYIKGGTSNHQKV